MKPNLGLVFSPAFDWMISPTHPERQERLLYTRDQLLEEGIFDLPQIREYRPRIATINEIERVHIGVPNIEQLITSAHLVSAGSCLTAADAVMQGEVKRAFALVRPPGHHAMRVVYGIRGFCVINIEAIMVSYLREKYGVKKIAIVDTDVHHGDGTQDIFYNDPNTLYISFHQDGRTLYPGSGFPNEAGTPGAFGTNINLPLLPGTGDEGVHRLFDGLIRPILDDFEPEIVINSAGQDNHFSDPLASMSVTAQGYASLASKLKADIAVLEGGYSVEAALPYVNTGIILAMAELDYSRVVEPGVQLPPKQPNECKQRIEQLIEQVGNMWQNRDVLRKKALVQCGSDWSRNKNIYYDEAGISEAQKESVLYCQRCSGFMTLETSASRTPLGKQNAFIICLFADTCQECQKMARQQAEQAKATARWQHVFVQHTQTGIIEEI